jgi:hypothetical protein
MAAETTPKEDVMILVRLVLVLGLFVVLACSCARGGRVSSGLNMQGVDVWLESKAASSAKGNLTGKWDAGSAFAGGWGEGNIIQEKGRFNGTLGMYGIRGVVSGNEASFVLTSNGMVYYTGTMTKKSAGSWAGKAVKDVLVDTEAAKTAETYPINFQKM